MPKPKSPVNCGASMMQSLAFVIIALIVAAAIAFTVTSLLEPRKDNLMIEPIVSVNGAGRYAS